MTVQDLTNAIINGINDGGEQFMEGTLAAALPIIWLVILGLHLGRPYILDMIGRFTLRLCVAQTMTEMRHVQGAWNKIREVASRVTQDQARAGT